MIEGLIAGLHQAASMCEYVAGVERRNGDICAADALLRMARALRLRASEEKTPVDHEHVVEVEAVQTWWRRFLRWWIA